MYFIRYTVHVRYEKYGTINVQDNNHLPIPLSIKYGKVVLGQTLLGSLVIEFCVHRLDLITQYWQTSILVSKNRTALMFPTFTIR